MLKLMAVDDEQIVLDSIRFLVEREVEDFTLVATARSGREAILKAEETVPDLILMDIRMPGIDGLEAIREIKQRLPAMRFIIISAYEQFGYARQAIELGVLDYVVKPLKRQMLRDILAKAALELERERRRRQRDLENLEKLEKLMPVLEQGFIHSILLHRELGGEIEKYRDLFDLSSSHAYMMVIEMQDPMAAGQENAIGTGIRAQSLYPSVCERLRSHRVALVGPLIVNRIDACLMVDARASSGLLQEDLQDATRPDRMDDAGNEYQQRLSAISLAEDLLAMLSGHEGLSCRIGIGGLHPVADMVASHDEAIRALHLAPNGGIVHIMDVRPAEPGTMDWIRFEQGLLTGLEEGDEAGLAGLLERIFAEMSVLDPKARNKLIEWMVVAHRVAAENDVREDRMLDCQTYLSELLGISSESLFRDWYVQRIQLLAARIREARSGKTSRIIETARRILEAEFATEISLEGLANRVNLSPRYFSRLFKDETGTNFIDCLTTLRIDKAKELMRKTDKSVKEICYEVGYSDPNYFSRLFRKQTGVTPTEFAGR